MPEDMYPLPPSIAEYVSLVAVEVGGGFPRTTC